MSLDGTLGTIVIGAAVGTVLFGIMTMQTFNYYDRYSKDPARLKVLVAAVWFLELGHTITLWHALYRITVTFYGQIAHILDPPPSLALTVLFSTLIYATVQTFFALRIWTLSGSYYITIVCSILTTARFAFSLTILSLFLGSNGFEIFTNKIHWSMIAVSSLGPAVDLLIAGSLCFFLWRRRSESHFNATRKLLDTLILWSIETTAITCAVGVMQLIFFLAKSDLAWLTFNLIQPKLFSNSLLAHLNSRERIRNQSSDMGSVVGDELQFAPRRGTCSRGGFGGWTNHESHVASSNGGGEPSGLVLVQQGDPCQRRSVTVVMVNEHTDVSGGMRWISNYHDELVERFLATRSDGRGFPSWGKEIDEQIAIAGNYEWNFGARRYFGNEGPEIQKTRTVVIE
ncbi:hypothetical protein GGX14DRAFT_697468 [Mycena pura]|uniref:DUF6534 domain-containing protein n=1 Tax=Mycena pura TaxID=153505 RepID=A0AAD6VF68_9AGAR|nr:hypothetical protein GGX14DRAFT_697468 [Mycena pura]